MKIFDALVAVNAVERDEPGELQRLVDAAKADVGLSQEYVVPIAKALGLGLRLAQITEQRGDVSVDDVLQQAIRAILSVGIMIGKHLAVSEALDGIATASR